MKRIIVLTLILTISAIQINAQIVDSLTVDYFKDSIQNRKTFQLKHKSIVIKFKVFNRRVSFWREAQTPIYESNILIEHISDDITRRQTNELLRFVAKQLEVEKLIAFKDYRACRLFYQPFPHTRKTKKHLRKNCFIIDFNEN